MTESSDSVATIFKPPSINRSSTHEIKSEVALSRLKQMDKMALASISLIDGVTIIDKFISNLTEGSRGSVCDEATTRVGRHEWPSAQKQILESEAKIMIASIFLGDGT
jgi:hypothetical protein